MARVVKDYKTRLAREERIQEMIEQGFSLNDMARELDISAQSVHRFMTSRGWKTKNAGGQDG